MTTFRRRGAAAIAAFMFLLAACGSSDNGDANGSSGDGGTATTGSSGGNGDSGGGGNGGGEAAGDADTSAIFRWAYSSANTGLDPHETTSTFQYQFLEPVYDALVTRTVDGEFVPGVAESWELSDDGLTFTMQIAEGRTFHDGTPLDADAVMANLERVRGIGNSVSAELNIVDSIEVDGSTVTLNLNAPGGRLPAVLSDYAGMMMAPASFDDEDRYTFPIGSGPFTVTENIEGKIGYTKWEDYHNADAIQMAGLEILIQSDDNTRLAGVQSGELDATFIRTSQVAQAEAAGLQIDAAPRTFFYNLALNTSSETLADGNVRKALSHAINRDAINAGLYDNACVPSVQPYPESFWGFNQEGTVEAFSAYDPELAKELLAEAGYPDGFTLQIGALSITTYSSMVEVLQAQFGEIGVTVEPVIQDSAQFTTTVRQGGFEAWIGPLETGRPDVTSFWATNYLPDGVNNPGGFELDGLQELLDQAHATTETSARAEAVHEMVMLSLEQGPRVLSICIPDLVFVSRNNVHNLKVPIDGNYTFRAVYLTED